MKTLHRIIEAAVQAPTGDNCQPWLFTSTSTGLQLTYDRTIAASVFNVRDVPTQLALGAAWENMALQAAQLGLRASADITLEETESSASGAGSDTKPVTIGARPLLSFNVEADPQVTADPLVRQIFQRRTNRRPYQRRALDLSATSALQQCANNDVDVRVLSGREATRLFPLISQCDKLRWEHAPLIRELFTKIRFDSCAKFSSRNGLAYDTLGVEGAAFRALCWLAQGRRAELLGPRGLSIGMAMQTQLLLKRSSALVLIRCRPNQIHSVIAAGRVMQRVWLTATEHQVALQPLASVPLLCLRALLARWQELTESSEDCYPVMAFRAGYGSSVPPALRKPISAFVTQGALHEPEDKSQTSVG